jgi:hypothetical protein
MLIRDFERSTPVTMAEIENRSYAFELAVRFARLLAPVL